MKEEEFNKYLESIGGLKNGYYPDREPIISARFFEISSGWYEMVKNLIDELIVAGWDKQVCQVKEKFGQIRFYTNATNSECDKIISKYEDISSTVCEECGEPGELRQGGWISTLCELHSGGREPFSSKL